MTRKTKQNKNLPHLEAELPVYEVKGITGTSLSAGYVTGKEHNPKLTTKNWVKEAEEMLASDPIIKRSWNLVKQTLLSAKWIFKPGVEGDPVAEELARFANEAFGFDGQKILPAHIDSEIGNLVLFQNIFRKGVTEL